MFKIIFIIALIAYVRSDCNSIVPNIFSDCVESSDVLNYCCYAYSPIGKKCISKSRSAWKTTNSIILLADNTQYILDCGVASTFQFNSTDTYNTLGIPNNVVSLNSANQGLPDVGLNCGSNQGQNSTLNDCIAGSHPFNDCCLYEFNGSSMCFLLGKTYNGTLSYGNIKVTCSSEWIRVYGFILLSLLLIFI
jgi:hypothetical protein